MQGTKFNPWSGNKISHAATKTWCSQINKIKIKNSLGFTAKLDRKYRNFSFTHHPNTCGVLFCFVFLLVLSTTCHMVREGFPSDSLPGKVQRTELRGVFIFLSIMVYHRIFFLKICLFTYFGCGGSLLLHKVLL